MAGVEPAGQLARLLAAYAPAGQWGTHRLLWALDERLADVARTTREPMIGQMRLTWWHEALADTAGVKGRGEPLVDAMRAQGCAGAPGIAAMVDGWEALLGDPDLEAFAAGRGGGLFRALADADDPSLEAAGRVWALWDLSGHVGNPALASRAVALARGLMPVSLPAWPRGWKPMRIAYGLARADVLEGRAAPAGLTPGLYLRLWRLALLGA